MVPFRLTFQPGIPVFEQVVYAAKKAVVSGQMRPGEAFPSVRAIAREFKINPNTAGKVVAQLIAEGLVEVNVGVGTVVAMRGQASAAEKSRLLKGEIERLVVEAKKLRLSLDDVLGGVRKQWERLGGEEGEG